MVFCVEGSKPKSAMYIFYEVRNIDAIQTAEIENMALPGKHIYVAL